MVKLIKVENGNPVPYSISKLKKEYRNVGIPQNPTNRFLSKFDVYPLYEQEKPEYDKFTQRLKGGPIEYNNGRWEETWQIIEMTAEEQAAYLEEYRSNLRIYKRAFRFALDQIIYSANTQANTSVSLLEAIQGDIDTRPVNDPTRRAWEDVTIYERSHPDMALLYNAGLTDEQIDDIFHTGILFETDPTAFEPSANT